MAVAFEIPLDVLVLAQIPRLLRGEDVDFTPYVSVMLTTKIVDSLRTAVPVPTEFAGIVDILVFAEKMRAFTSAIRGAEYEPALDRIVSMIVSLYMIEAISKAFAT